MYTWINALAPYWHYTAGRQLQLVTLQILMILRPFLGATGFMLIVPLLQNAGLLDIAESGRTIDLISYLPVFDSLTAVLVVFFLVSVLLGAVNLLHSMLAESFEQHLLVSLRKELYGLLMNSEWQQMSRTHQADYTRIITEDVVTVQSAFDQSLQFVSQLVLISFYSLLCLYLSPLLTLVAVALGVLLLLSGLPFQKLIVDIGDRHLEGTRQLFRIASSQILGIKTVKSSVSEQKFLDQFAETTSVLSEQQKQYTKVSSITRFAHSLASAFAFCLITYTALAHLEVDTPTLIILAVIFSRLLPQVAMLNTYLQRFAYMLPDIQVVTKLISQCWQQQEALGNEPLDGTVSSIELRSITYQYPGATHPVLKDLNCQFNSGQLVAIIGKSGIGKSTLADIVAGITMPTSGTLLVDGKAINRDNFRTWRSRVFYVPQEPFLLDASIRDNLTLLTTEPISDEKLKQALADAACTFVDNLDHGLDSNIGENGISLSAGERQRLLLARALLSDREVLILDETTSSLDIPTEEDIIRTLKKLRASKLVIVISHRLSIRDVANKVLDIGPK